MFEMLNSVCSILKDYPLAKAIKSTAGALEYMRSPRCEETLVKPPFEYISQLLLISQGIVRIKKRIYKKGHMKYMRSPRCEENPR